MSEPRNGAFILRKDRRRSKRGQTADDRQDLRGVTASVCGRLASRWNVDLVCCGVVAPEGWRRVRDPRSMI